MSEAIETIEPEKFGELTQEQKNELFHVKLEQTVKTIEATINAMPSNEACVLFASAIEGVAEQFKRVFLNSLEKQWLMEAKMTKGQIRRNLLKIEATGKYLMKVNQSSGPK
jgi:hypothetical protein